MHHWRTPRPGSRSIGPSPWRWLVVMALLTLVSACGGSTEVAGTANPALESSGRALSPTTASSTRETGTNTPGHEGESNQFVVNFGDTRLPFYSFGFRRP